MTAAGDDDPMADPKYANLPGLDLDAPDVYETDDRWVSHAVLSHSTP